MTQSQTPIPPQGNQTRASNVALPLDLWNWIDQKQLEVKRSGWGNIRKNQIIQAALLAAIGANSDLSGCESVDDIADRLRQSTIQQDTAVWSAVELAERLLNVLKQPDS